MSLGGWSVDPSPLEIPATYIDSTRWEGWTCPNRIPSAANYSSSHVKGWFTPRIWFRIEAWNGGQSRLTPSGLTSQDRSTTGITESYMQQSISVAATRGLSSATSFHLHLED